MAKMWVRAGQPTWTGYQLWPSCGSPGIFVLDIGYRRKMRDERLIIRADGPREELVYVGDPTWSPFFLRELSHRFRCHQGYSDGGRSQLLTEAENSSLVEPAMSPVVHLIHGGARASVACYHREPAPSTPGSGPKRTPAEQDQPLLEFRGRTKGLDVGFSLPRTRLCIFLEPQSSAIRAYDLHYCMAKIWKIMFEIISGSVLLS